MVRRLAALGMMFMEAVLLWRTMGYLPIALLAILVAGIGCLRRVQRDWGYRQKLIASTLVVLVYLAWWWLDLQYLEPSRSAQFGNNLSLAFVLGLMMLQAIHFSWRHPVGLPDYFPLLGILALAFAADNYLTGAIEHRIVFSLCMGFALSMGIFYTVNIGRKAEGVAPYRIYKGVLLSLCLLLSFALAGGTAWAIGNSDRAIAQWLVSRNFVKKSLVLGNQQTARLSSMTDIKAHNVDSIALQIVSENSPGYLRGQVYDRYQQGAWRALPAGNTPTRAWIGPEGYLRQWQEEVLYPVRSSAKTVAQNFVVYPDAAIEHALFAPLETAYVGVLTGEITVNSAGIAQSKRSQDGEPYHLLSMPPTPAIPLSGEEEAMYLSLPPEMAPRLSELAARICAGRSSTLGKVNAVTQHFTGNYDYSLGILIPDGLEPLDYFLFSDSFPAAHCEYFATGAALLLRAVGVPTRYVTGVGVWEQHPFAHYWVARNRDAHAWVEAWDAEEGWYIVEATPASGLPESVVTGEGSNLFRDFWSMLRLNTKRLMAALREGAWTAVVEAMRVTVVGLLEFLRQVWWSSALLVLLVIGSWRFRCWFRRRHLRRSGDVVLAQQQLQEQLSAMDHWVNKRHQVERSSNMTAHRFAHRLEESDLPTGEGSCIAQWYRQWAAIRYRSQVDPKAVEDSKAAMDALRHPKA